MKRLAIGVLASVASMSVYSHGHGPITYGGSDAPMDALTLSQTKVIKIAIKNTNTKPTAFEISVNGELIKVTKHLNKGRYHYYNVPVTMNKPNTPEIHNVCSKNVIDKDSGVGFAIIMCTEAKLYWIKD